MAQHKMLELMSHVPMDQWPAIETVGEYQLLMYFKQLSILGLNFLYTMHINNCDLPR